MIPSVWYEMDTRRSFLKRLLAWCGSTCLLLSSATRVALSHGRKILPKETRATVLFQDNPATLDIRHVEVTPLRLFGAMGQTAHTVDLAAWRLEVSGEVDRPFRLAYEDITALPQTERRVLLVCPDTFSFLAHWKGFSLKALLERARVREGVQRVEIRSADDLIERVESFPVEDIWKEKVFLAYAVNGERLPERHGFPLRVVAEDRYGNHWVKYVASVKALDS